MTGFRYEKITPFLKDPLFLSLPGEEQEFIEKISEKNRFTHQQIKGLTDMAADLRCWDEGTLRDFWNTVFNPSEGGGSKPSASAAGMPDREVPSPPGSREFPADFPRRAKDLFKKLITRWEALKLEEKDYSGFVQEKVWSGKPAAGPETHENFPSEGSYIRGVSGTAAAFDAADTSGPAAWANDSASQAAGRAASARPVQSVRIEELPDRDEPLLGLCPVAGERTRCCNLQTLDAVRRCGFGCSYCSIQTFYGGGAVYFHRNLREKLKGLRLDPQKIYHIGTGQSSDSLMWGNRGGLLDDLFSFAREHPRVILELKTKAAGAPALIAARPPRNVIAGWTLNTETIISAEELLTAPLADRLGAARAAADAGVRVGFHFHPMVLYKGWREEYLALSARLRRMFRPEEVVMISLGTVTLIKPVIRRIRLEGRRSKILRMPLTETAGKYSYPRDVKIELFKTLYEDFPAEWRKAVFFYLCMEDPDIWEPVFGYSYPDNASFEEAMKRAYYK